jgi:hypothetical protein
MKRIAIAFVVLGLAACGGSESGDTATAPEGSPAAGATAQEGTGAAGGSAATSPTAQRCLDLVREAKFAEAVPVCTRAAGMDPEDARVQEALQTARAKAAELPDVAAEADEAAKEAGSELEGATKGMGPKLE